MKKRSQGQSLFEVVFAVGIAALVLVGVVSVAAVSIRNTSFSQNKTKATKYSQEAVEWLREQRDSGWDNLADPAHSSTDPGTSTGLGELNWEDISNIPNTNFKRDVVLVLDPAGNQIKATVSVSWADSQGDHSVESVTYFTDWTKRL